jgi:hypothetical protein
MGIARRFGNAVIGAEFIEPGFFLLPRTASTYCFEQLSA